jgi:hypothetical protein
VASLASLFVTLGLKDEATPGIEKMHARLVAEDRTEHKVRLSLPDITPEIKAMQGKLSALEKNKIRLAVDRTGFNADVDTLTHQLERLREKRTSVPVDLAPGLDREIARVERELATAGRKVTTIPLRLEQTDAKIAAVQGELARLRKPVDVPVEVGGRTLREKVATARAVISGGISPSTGAMEHAGSAAGGHYSEGFVTRVKELTAEIGRALIGGFVAVGSVEVFRKLIDEGERAEHAVLLTEAVLKSTGEVAGVTGGQVDKLTESLSRKDGIDQAQVRTGENLLLTFTGIRNEVGKGNDIYDQATEAVLNMSAALGQNTRNSAIQLGKALQDPVRGATTLRRVGVQLTQQQQDQIKAFVASGRTLEAQKVILHELGTEFGGAAEAAATPLDRLKATINGLAMTTGERLLPVVGRVADGIAGFVQGAQDGTGAGGHFRDTLSSIGGALRTAVTVGRQVLPVVRGLAGLLGGPLFASSKSVSTALAVMVGVISARKLAGAMEGLTLLAGRLQDLGGKGLVAGTRLAGLSIGVGRVASFLGGPWGIAIGLGVTALVGLATKQSAAAKAAKELTDQLTYQNGALDENSRQTLAKSLATAGSLSSAVKAGVAEKDYTDAIINGGAARQALIDQLKQTVREHTSFIDSGYGVSQTIDSTGKAAKSALDGLNQFSGSVDSGAQHSKEAADALGRQAGATRQGISPAKQMAAAQDKLTGATAKLNQVVQDEINKFTILRQGALDSEQANEEYTNALDAIRQQAKGAGKDLTALHNAQVAQATAVDRVKEAEQRLDAVRRDPHHTKAQLLTAEDRLREARRHLTAESGRVKDAEATLSEASKKSTASFNVNTAAGAANRALVVTWVKSLNDKVAADFRHAYSTSKSTTETGKLKDALRVANADIRQGKKDIDASSTAAGFNRGKVDQMVGSMLKTPGQLKTDVINNAEKAEAKAKHYQNTLNRFTGKTIHDTIVFEAKFKQDFNRMGIRVAGVNSSGGFTVGATGGSVLGKGWIQHDASHPRVQGKNDGGVVQNFTGRGMRGKDTEPALLAIGEHIWTDKEVDAVGGHRAVFRLRKAALQGKLRGFRAGGQVDFYPQQVHSLFQDGLYQGGREVSSSPLDVIFQSNRPPDIPRLERGTGQFMYRVATQAGTQLRANVERRLKATLAAAVAGLGDSALVHKALNDVGMRYAIGMCLQFIRTLVGAPGGEYSSMTAWGDTRMKHRGDWNAPPGAPMWWGGGLGHVALSVGGGKIVSTDLPTSGRIGLVDKHLPTTRWGKPYLGWTGDLNGTVIPLGRAFTGSALAGSGSVKTMAQQLLRLHGWEAQWPALDYIVGHESGWNVHARNASSGAYGLGQALPASKMAPYGSDWRDSANTQLRWMLAYIGSRYGDPNVAAAFWRAHHWYSGGGPVGLEDGVLIRGGRGGVLATVGEGARDELVTPLPRGWDSAKPPATSDQMLNTLIRAIDRRTAPLVHVDRVESGVDLDLFAAKADFKARAGGF